MVPFLLISLGKGLGWWENRGARREGPCGSAVSESARLCHASAIIAIASETLAGVSCPGRRAGLGAVACRQDHMSFLEVMAFPSSDPN